jgi:hypothetical protein
MATNKDYKQRLDILTELIKEACPELYIDKFQLDKDARYELEIKLGTIDHKLIKAKSMVEILEACFRCNRKDIAECEHTKDRCDHIKLNEEYDVYNDKITEYMQIVKSFL